MKAKYELKNFIAKYGLSETLDALADILIEQFKNSRRPLVKNFLDDMSNEFEDDE